MKEIFKRSLTGTALVVVMLGAILGGELTFLIFFSLLIVGSLWEFYQLANKMNIVPQKIWGMVGGVLIFTLFYLSSKGLIRQHYAYILIIWGLISFVLELWRNNEQPFLNIAYTWFGTIYVAIPIAMLLAIAYRDNIYQYNYHLVLSYFILIWTYDTMAYVSGILFGKHKLLVRISPKKTWEGALGGLIFAIIVSYVLSFYFTELTRNQWWILAIIISIFGTLGDLAESMLKRSVGVKDSGNLLPGHGGLLDRFDSLFLALPAVYLYLQLY